MAKLQLRKQFDHRERSFSVADAVEYECDGSDYDRGSVETAAATARQTSELVGRLVAKLHDLGVISPDEVIDILGGCWEVKR